MQKNCRFCLTICDENIPEIHQLIRDITEIVLPEMDLTITDKPVICNQCERVLKRCFHFKSMYFYTEDFILKFVNLEGTMLETLDLKELYLKKHNLPDSDLLNSGNVCRFCLALVTDESFILLADEDTHVLRKFVDLVALKLTLDPVACGSCYKSLICYSNFIDKCMEAEGKIRKFKELNTEEKIVPEEYLAFSSNCNESETDLVKVNCEQEEVKQILEDSKEKVQMELCPQKSIIESDIVYLKTKEVVGHQEDIHEGMLGEAKCEMKLQPTKQEELQRFHCESCTFTTKRETNLKKHALKHKDSSPLRCVEEWLHCSECSYKTKHTRSLKIHILKCQGVPSHPKKFSCDTAVRKYRLKNNSLIHKDRPEVTLFKCQHCDYGTMKKRNLQRHELVHKDPSELTKYKCQYCDYECIHKSYLIRHELVHKDLSEVTTYRCQHCDFETVYKFNLKKHELMHEDVSQLTKYKCQLCDYESIDSGNLKKHELIHKDPSQLTKYKCEHCDYESIYKSNLNTHGLVHKESTEITKYKCQHCSYECIQKGNLKIHELTHKDRSEVTKHKCHVCSFESIYKSSLKKHILKHTINLEKYKCQHCNYECIDKGNLKKHELLHQYPSELSKYKCHVCNFECIRKNNMRRHVSAHKKNYVK